MFGIVVRYPGRIKLVSISTAGLELVFAVVKQGFFGVGYSSLLLEYPYL